MSSILCCICQEKNKPSLQVHACKESLVCFDCLIKERWNNNYVEAFKNDIDNWWNLENPLNCPICSSQTKFLSPPDVLVDYWQGIKREFVHREYENLITRNAILESRLAVGQDSINLEKLHSQQWQDKYDELYLEFKKTDAELKNAMRRVIAEVDKNNGMVACYLNMKTRVCELLDEDDEEFNKLMLRTTPLKKRKRSPSPEYQHVNPDITCREPHLSDIFAENSQSQ